MNGSTRHFSRYQRGVSLGGLIFVLIILGVLAVFAMKVFPTYTEYRSVQAAIVQAKAAGGTAQAIQMAFNKNAEINDVTSVTGKDLIISKETGEVEVSFAYEKRIPLAGPVSLVIAYAGTTAKSGVVPVKPAE